MSRSLGDFELSKVLLAEPEIFEIEVAAFEENNVLVMACDGLYEGVTDDEIAQMCTWHLQQAPGDLEGLAKRYVPLPSRPPPHLLPG